ncbi:MAG TPA: hypothetical protein VGE04_02050 [Chloroflexia bacterium]
MATEEVINAIDESELLDTLQESTKISASQLAGNPEISARITAGLLVALNAFSIRAAQFNPAAIKLLEVIGLTNLTQASVWEKMVRFGDPSAYPELRSSFYSVYYVRRFLPRIVDMLRQEDVEAILGDDTAIAESKQKFDVLNVVVIEQEGRFSKPERLIEVLESILGMYQVCSTVLFEPSDDLCVVACDSGSDKSFDFLGGARVIECVKELLLGIWDNVAFRKERRLTQGIRAIGESLPVFEQIGTLEQEQRLPPEDAERLRHKLLANIDKFIEAGATTPEINKRAQYDPRLLMSPAPKLLTGPKIISVEVPPRDDKVQADASVVEVSNANRSLNPERLNKEEQAHLSVLLDKMRNPAPNQDQSETMSPTNPGEGQGQEGSVEDAQNNEIT